MAERDIKVEGNELVIHADGRVKRSPVPDWIDPKMFRHIVGAADLLYRQRGILPTVEQVVGHWSRFDPKVVGRVFTAPEFKAALEIRGIFIDPKEGLTLDQQNAISLLSNFADPRTTEAKLRSLGVSMATYRAWMRNPLFASMLNTQSEQNLSDAIPVAINRLVGKADSGDLNAINKVLEITGRWDPQQKEIQNARSVVMFLLEAVQKHVRDKETLKAIMDEVQQKTQAVTITQGMKEIG